MQIICISRGSQSLSEDFAKILASKLGYECISREDLLEEATKRRIPIGKLETSIIKPHLFNDRLARELELFKALATSILCEKALKGPIIYHGRTGHLLLPGISHILKIRIVADMECRINKITGKLDLPREKAKKYIEQIDEDRRKWIKQFYNTEWNVYNLYDIVLNLSYMSVNNSASAICSMAQLPEFQATPSSINALKDLLLASKAKLLLSQDKRTNSLNLRIRANSGVLNITYPLMVVDNIETVNSVLKNLDGVREIVYTEALTNILWIQEQFSDTDDSYNKVLSLAKNWDAAVELLKLVPSALTNEAVIQEEKQEEPENDSWRQTGIIEEGEELSPEKSKDMLKIYEKLITDGRAGGKRTITGSKKTLLNSVDKNANYKLIIFDNMFLNKGSATRTRLQTEWANTLTDLVYSPVVNLDELEFKYKFRTKHLIQLIINAALTVLTIFLIFHFSDQVIGFLTSGSSQLKILPTICILIFVPLFARMYSTVTSLLLKLIKIE